MTASSIPPRHHSPFVLVARLAATHKRAQTVSGPPQSPNRSLEISGSQTDLLTPWGSKNRFPSPHHGTLCNQTTYLLFAQLRGNIVYSSGPGRSILKFCWTTFPCVTDCINIRLEFTKNIFQKLYSVDWDRIFAEQKRAALVPRENPRRTWPCTFSLARQKRGKEKFGNFSRCIA